jgi:hypothetical protein
MARTAVAAPPEGLRTAETPVKKNRNMIKLDANQVGNALAPGRRALSPFFNSSPGSPLSEIAISFYTKLTAGEVKTQF